MKNAKVLLFFKIFKLFSLLFDHKEKRRVKKAEVNFKIYDFMNWEVDNHNTHIAKYPKRKGNRSIKFVQLIEYIMRNIFLKSYTKREENSPRIFSKKSKLSIFWMNSLKSYIVCVYCMSKSKTA